MDCLMCWLVAWLVVCVDGFIEWLVERMVGIRW